MTGVNFASLIREYTRTNSSSLTNATIVLLANVVKDEFAPKIKDADEDLFGVVSTRNLIASSTSREYSLPDDNLRIIRVEAKFDGTNWVKLEEFNLAQHARTTDEATITGYFSNNAGGAEFDIFRNSLWLYSGTITPVTGGLKLYYIAYPADLVTGDLSSESDLSLDPTTTTSQLPRQFHELWARRVSIMWKSNREKPIPLNEREQKFDIDFREAIGGITNQNQDRDNYGRLPDDSKWQV